jgi:hypothetical protein
MINLLDMLRGENRSLCLVRIVRALVLLVILTGISSILTAQMFGSLGYSYDAF